MYTPNELKEMSFSKAVFGGYDTADVDKVFGAVCDDYATLFKENAMLKKKLKLLADTVEDYRSVDEAMRKALITAQNMANEMMEDAKRKSQEIIDSANDNAKAKAYELSIQIASEEKRLAEAKTTTAEFIEKMLVLFDTEREKFAALKGVIPASTEPAAPTEAAEPVVVPAEPVKMTDTLEEISKSLEERVKFEEAEIARTAEAEREREAVAENSEVKLASDTIPFESNIPTEEEMEALEAAAEKMSSRRHRVEFENLKFGTDYDIKND